MSGNDEMKIWMTLYRISSKKYCAFCVWDSDEKIQQRNYKDSKSFVLL